MNRMSNIVTGAMRSKSSSSRSDKAHCSVVGGGVVGLSVAMHLLEAGAGVTLFERTGIASGASGVQPGGVRQQWGTRANCLMARESFSFYDDFPNRYETTARAHLDHCGYLFVATEDASLRQLRGNIAVQQEVGIPSQLLTPEEAATIVPSLNSEQILGAAYCAEDGYFDRPQAVVEAFAEVVARDGGTLEFSGVSSITRDGAGWRLLLDDGRSHTSDAVVVATGYDTPELLSPLGYELPITKEARYLFYSDHIKERLLEPLVIDVDRGLAAKHLADGRVLASDLHAEGEPELHQDAWRRRIREIAVELLPILEYVPLPIIAPGYYDMTPDGQPVIDELEDGLWVAAGFSGHGFMVAPVAGQAIAAAISGRHASAWIDAVRAERFRSAVTDAEAQVI
jgi:sarcosine oxidase subunit beta